MGDIAKVLSKVELKSKPLFNDSLRIESAEATHIHWRDLRIIMSEEQTKHFLDGSHVSSLMWNGKHAGEDLVLSQEFLPGDILFGNEAKVELLKDGNIHVHWRDLRLELEPKDFSTLSVLLEEARKEYNR